MRRVQWVVLAGLAACTGGETGFDPITPRIAVSHDALDFGDQPIFSPGTQELYIINDGLRRSAITLSLAGDDVFSTDPLETSVAAGETLTVPLTFLPTTFLEYGGTLHIQTEDPEHLEHTVTLSGLGVPAPVPDIELSTLALDFGDVAAGGLGTSYFVLRNIGTAPLQLGSVRQEGSGRFTFPSLPSNGSVAPDTEITVVALFQPDTEDGDSGKLIIPSNDPDEPEVSVLTIGNGGSDVLYPVADIACPTTVAPPEWVPLDGSGSSDPGNLALTYAWSVPQRPQGSQAELSTFVDVNTRLFADIAGSYEVQLVVTNALGVRSAPARCLFEGVPSDDLHVELTWDTAHADLDLHVMQDGSNLFEKPGDCTFCNPEPNWGGSSQVDDPHLDLDAQHGFGPENINITTPVDGQYHVKVHYFEEHGDGAATARVRIYTYGQLQTELTQVLTRNQVWDVAQVNLPAGTVGVPTGAPWTAVDRACY